jgi:indolepyruvate ferredoxin oxidoreductase
VPEGSRAMAGIGCHFMTIWMDRSTVGFTQMGGEGVPWVGQQPFTTDKHMFANLGDGTYFHSGLLAVRQSIASGVNITYKILYNDAVAMTGGQQIGERPEGHSVVQIAQSMRAEGAKKIVVVTDEPEKYHGVALAEGVEVFHRDELDRIQREFREIEGTTVIIYDQTCATEKRRRRKRGKLVDPAIRVVINEAVCEGCGDCGVQSNCMSVEPLETELGRKRTINQSTCNKDVSCVKGFCPSFITVEGGQLKKKSKTDAKLNPFTLGDLPSPTLPSTAAPYGMIVAGVGGTGIITIGQLLGMAAHMEGKGIVTQDAAGLAQKGGATWSHVIIADTPDDIRTTRVSMADADLIFGCDPLVTANKETLLRMRPGKTHVALNVHSTPTAAFVTNGNWHNPAEQCAAQIAQAVGPGDVGSFNADAAATKLMGDSIFVNPMVLGYAWQKGWVPLALDSLMRAMELNNVAIEQNKQAFTWGRQAAHDWAAVERLLSPAQVIAMPAKRDSVQALIARRVELLTAYQNAAYAQEYKTFVDRVAVKGNQALTEAVAKYLYKLMAYKDEYEVARLHTDTTFLDKIAAQFEGDYQLHYHLAPPLISKKDNHGHLVKQKFGPAMLTGFKILAKLKGLRGTAFDVFGKTAERKMERALIGQYKASIEEVLQHLNADNASLALEIARIPELIKGYGHVKERNVDAAQLRWTMLMAQLLETGVVRKAA